MGFKNWLKELLGMDTGEETTAESVPASNPVASAPAVAFEIPMDEAEKELVAVIVSCIAGSETPDVNLHIQKIRRIQ